MSQCPPPLNPTVVVIMLWALSKAKKKKYDDTFRSWDSQNMNFIDGLTVLSVFRDTGLPQNNLASIW